MKIIVIIVTYNGKRWYERCFGSLRQSTIPVDVMVIDNASTDGTVEWIKEHHPEVHLVQSPKNIGFGQANNIGMCYALENNYDYVFLLNQDAWLYNNDCIERLVEVAEKPEYAHYYILSALWLYGKGDRLTKGTPIQLAIKSERGNDFVSDLFFSHPLQEVYHTGYIGAAAWLLSRKTLQTIGGFDPLFFHRGEDDNYMQRVHYHGGKIGICPQALVCHDIEERPIDYDMEHENWQKNLLIDVSNVNDERTVQHWQRVYRVQALKQWMYFHWKAANNNWKTYRFLCYKARDIQYSRMRNTKLGAHWL